MKLYLYIAAIAVVLGAVFYIVRARVKANQEARVQAILKVERDKVLSGSAEALQTGEEPYSLHAGDTALVPACDKSFMVKGNGIARVAIGPAVPKDYATIAQPDAGQFELTFSCESIKNQVGVFPLIFTTTQGKELTIYVIPLSDLNGSLQYHRKFEILQ